MTIRTQRAVAAIAALIAGLATTLCSAGPAGAAVTGRIAFNRAGDIYVANRDGSQAKRITFFNGSAGYPRWSPDGKTILFQARGSVWRIQPDGNGWAVLCSPGNGRRGPRTGSLWFTATRLTMFGRSVCAS